MLRKFVNVIAVAILGLPATVWARGQGSTYYFLSPDGMSITLGTQDRKYPVISDIDYHAELVYQRNGKKLSALTFGGKTLWSIKQPKDEGPSFFDSRSGVLNITQYSGNWWLGLDPKTGKQVFRVPAEQASNSTRSLPGIEDAREPQAYWYCLEDTEDNRQVLRKFDRRTAQRVWQKELPERVRQWGELHFVSIGLVQWEKGIYCFDPERGAELTKIPTDAKTTRQVFWHKDAVFHLSAEEPATLTAFDPATQKVKWSVKGLNDILDMAGPYEYQRLICRGKGVIHVIDTKAGKLLTTIRAFAFPRELSQAKDAIVACYTDPKYHVECFELPTGKLLWSRPHGSYYSGAVLWQDRVMIVEPAKAAKRREQEPPPVSVVSLKDGKELWRWQVPQFKDHFYDSVWASVRATQSGFVVTRTWRVLD